MIGNTKTNTNIPGSNVIHSKPINKKKNKKTSNHINTGIHNKSSSTFGLNVRWSIGSAKKGGSRGEFTFDKTNCTMSGMDETELQHLYSWIDEVPLSRPKKNITRDFSDGGKSPLRLYCSCPHDE